MLYAKTHGRGGSAPFVRACVAVLSGILVSGATMTSTPGAVGLAAAPSVKSARSNAARQVRIRNEEGAPVVVAKVALEKRAQPDPLSPTGRAPVVTVTLRNTTDRRVSAFALSLNVGSRFSTSFQPAAEIAPRSTYTVEAAVPAGDPRQLVVGVVGVRFEDGSSWGSFPALPEPSLDSPAAVQSSGAVITEKRLGESQGGAEGVTIKNAEGAPVVVAKVALEKRAQPDPLSPTGRAPVVTVTLRNTTDRRVSAFALSLNVGSRFSTSFQPAAEIAPRSTYTVEAAVPAGDPRQLVVGVVGVRFEDGSSWGSFPALPR